jgi:hypothetical protein
MLTAKKRLTARSLSNSEHLKDELKTQLGLPKAIGLLEVWDRDFEDWVGVGDLGQIADKAKLRVSYTESSTASGGGGANGPVFRVGATLDGGRYTLTELIAEGGMGSVFKGTDSSLGQVVVVKIPQRAEDARRLRRTAPAPQKRIYWEGRLWAPGYPWMPPSQPWVRLGPLGASPVAGGGGHLLAFGLLSNVAARGGQTGADHFSSKPRLVLPTAPQIGRGGRRNAFKLQIWAIGGPSTRHRQAVPKNQIQTFLPPYLLSLRNRYGLAL